MAPGIVRARSSRTWPEAGLPGTPGWQVRSGKDDISARSRTGPGCTAPRAQRVCKGKSCLSLERTGSKCVTSLPQVRVHPEADQVPSKPPKHTCGTESSGSHWEPPRYQIPTLRWAGGWCPEAGGGAGTPGSCQSGWLHMGTKDRAPLPRTRAGQPRAAEPRGPRDVRGRRKSEEALEFWALYGYCCIIFHWLFICLK